MAFLTGFPAILVAPSASADRVENEGVLPNSLWRSAGVEFDGVAYIIAGENEGGYRGEILRYDPATRTTTQVATMPARAGIGAARVGDAIYIMGGMGASNAKYSDIYRFYPSNATIQHRGGKRRFI